MLREGLDRARSWTHPTSADFVSFQWCSGRRSRMIFAVYRVLAALYFAAWLVMAVVWKKPPRVYFLIYLTYWTLIIFTFYLLLSALIAIFLYLKDKWADRTWMRRLLAANWALYYICADTNLFIVASFWLLEYQSNTQTRLSQDLNVHALNGVFFIINLALSAQPHYLAHAWVPVCYATIYGTFMVTWWALGGRSESDKRYVYETANFDERPVQAAITVIVLIFVVVPLLHSVVWALTRLRVCIFRRYVSSRDRISPKSSNASTDLSVISDSA
uniref:Protein rolling stone-like n=1 Tax=Plectus sambesii TaxID=2011161 RepID=A0A914X0F0_9BILA